MSADIVDRLKYYAAQMEPSGLGGPGYALSPAQAPLLRKAAIEISRLRERNEKLRTSALSKGDRNG